MQRMWGRSRKKKTSGEPLTVKSVITAMHVSTKWGQVGDMTFTVPKDNVS